MEHQYAMSLGLGEIKVFFPF